MKPKIYATNTKNPAPLNGQESLSSSIELKSTTSRRIGVEEDHFVVFDNTNNGTYHGHQRSWEELTDDMKSALYQANLVENVRTGKIKK